MLKRDRSSKNAITMAMAIALTGKGGGVKGDVLPIHNIFQGFFN